MPDFDALNRQQCLLSAENDQQWETVVDGIRAANREQAAKMQRIAMLLSGDHDDFRMAVYRDDAFCQFVKRFARLALQEAHVRAARKMLDD